MQASVRSRGSRSRQGHGSLRPNAACLRCSEATCIRTAEPTDANETHSMTSTIQHRAWTICGSSVSESGTIAQSKSVFYVAKRLPSGYDISNISLPLWRRTVSERTRTGSACQSAVFTGLCMPALRLFNQSAIANLSGITPSERLSLGPTVCISAVSQVCPPPDQALPLSASTCKKHSCEVSPTRCCCSPPPPSQSERDGTTEPELQRLCAHQHTSPFHHHPPLSAAPVWSLPLKKPELSLNRALCLFAYQSPAGH